jgi:curved DNA-binding protein CbpA
LDGFILSSNHFVDFCTNLRDNLSMARIYDRDPYAILGISLTATTSQVKEAYHWLARQYHPDLNKDPRAGERMKDINWAYDLLSDPQERSLYDYYRKSSVRTEYYYPGTGYSNPTPPSSHTTSSTGNQTRNPPPFNPYRGRAYPNARAAQGSSTVGCSPWGIILVFVIVIANVARSLGPSLSQRPNYNYSPGIRATQTAQMKIQMERLDSAIETLHASETRSAAGEAITSSPPFWLLVTPSPVNTVPKQAGPSQEGWRARIVPGTWEYHYISIYFPQLTTPDGLSDEVTDVIYDQLRGYQIKTRSSGEYWLHINNYDNSVSGEYIPPQVTATPPG